MSRSHIHGFDVGLATDTIRHYAHGNLYWSVAFRTVSILISNSTVISETVFEHVQNSTTVQKTVVHPYQTVLDRIRPF
jgi:hypothetical protein